MAKFSEYFKLGLTQQALDFVDIDTDHDTHLYVDPYAIEIKNDLWSEQASDYIRTFFLEVLEALRSGDEVRAENLMSHFQEPQETFLGESKNKPQGRGVGQIQSGELVKAIRQSRAFATGLLSDLSEMALYVEHVNRDKISDLTTNIIRFLLVDYTQQQCDLLGIETQDYVGPSGWNNERRNWEARRVQLPYIDGKAVMLVPKFAVRRRLSLDSQEFYNKQITDFLVAEQYRATSSLAQTLKGGKVPKVYKKDVREANPKSKSLIAKMVNDHPDLLELYKKVAKQQGVMLSFSADDASIPQVCRLMAEALKTCPPGRHHADQYHRLMLGILTLLFYPELIQPRKEWEIHDGRKRIDIVFTNAADSGFFAHRRDGKNTNANVVIVECKNYSDDIENQELDQLLARFADNRGRFGIITCRQVEDVERLSSRCLDMSSRSTGFIIVLTDDDILKLLHAKETLQDDQIEAMLHRKFRKLLE